MSLKQPLMIKTVVGNTDLSLEADAGESILVKDIHVYNPSSDYATVKIDKATVGYFRVGSSKGNHLSLPAGALKHSHSMTVGASDGSLTEDHAITNAYGQSNANLAMTSDASSETEYDDVVGFGGNNKPTPKTILKLMSELNMFSGYPIAEGQKLTMSGVSQAGSIAIVVYELHDAADIKSTDLNGSDSRKYQFINYGRLSSAATGSTDNEYDTQKTPSEFPGFPFGTDAPANKEITLYGFLLSDAVDDRGSNDDVATTYLKLVQDRNTLFDDDRNGILCYGLTGNTADGTHIGQGISLSGNFSDKDVKPPFIFPKPITFRSGEELGLYLTTAAGGSQSSASLSAAETEIGLLMAVNIK